MTNLMIIGAGIDQAPAYEVANELGLNTIAIDMSPAAPAFNYATWSHVISTKDVNGVVKLAKQIDRDIGIHGVITIGAEVAPTVSAVAEALSLPSVSTKAAHLTTNKCARANVFKGAGIRFPNFAVLDNKNQDHSLTYPLVIKPSDNSASRGVRIVENDTELYQAFEQAQALASDQKIILEEYIQGDQISIEGVVIDNQLHVTAIADRNYSRNDYFYPLMVEDGGEMPTKFNSDVVQRMCDALSNATKALGIHTGPTKGDLIITPDHQVYVIEVTSRLSGGGYCSRVVPRVNGINIVKTTIQLALGQQVDLYDLKPKFSNGMCHRYFFHKTGKITNIAGLEQLSNKEGVVEVVMNREISVGDILEPVTYANRIFYIITISDTREDAIRLAEQAMASVIIETNYQ